MNHKTKLLFILEEGTIERAYIGSSNDLLLLFSLLKRSEIDLYLINPQDFIEEIFALHKSDNQKMKTIKIASSKEQLLAIENSLHKSYAKEVINLLLKQSHFATAKDEMIGFNNAYNQENSLLNLSEISIIFNRSEPSSLSDGRLHSALASLSKELTETELHKKFTGMIHNPLEFQNDKAFVYNLHYAGRHPLLSEGGDLECDQASIQNGKNKISLETEIISLPEFSDARDAVCFYEILSDLVRDHQNKAKSEDFDEEKFQAKFIEKFLLMHKISNRMNDDSQSLKQLITNSKLLSEKLQILLKASEKIMLFSKQESDHRFCLKPYNWFGGSGVVIHKSLLPVSRLQALSYIPKIFAGMLEDCGDEIQKAKLSKIIIQEYALDAKDGDLRIFFSFGKFQGAFIRANPDEKSVVGNIHRGGHMESFFHGSSFTETGIARMISEMKLANPKLSDDSKEIRKKSSLFDLKKRVEFLSNLPKMSEIALVGFDALLTEKNGQFHYVFNEGNITSPMGQSQIIIDSLYHAIAPIITKELLKILEEMNCDVGEERSGNSNHHWQSREITILAAKIAKELADLIRKIQGNLTYCPLLYQVISNFLSDCFFEGEISEFKDGLTSETESESPSQKALSDHISCSLVTPSAKAEFCQSFIKKLQARLHKNEIIQIAIKEEISGNVKYQLADETIASILYRS